MKVKCNDTTRCSRFPYISKCSRYCLLLACLRLMTYSSIQAFQFDATIISYGNNKAHSKAIKSFVYINYQTNSIIRKAKNQSDDEDDHDDDETPTNSQRRLARVRSRVTDLARKMVQVPIHVASSITPMPQAVAAVLKDATLNAADLAVEEGMNCTNFCSIVVRTSQPSNSRNLVLFHKSTAIQK